jgi:hypothetical protein
MILDVSLANKELYAGCQIEEIAGRRNLVTPVTEAVALLGRNIERIVSGLPPGERDQCVLTGAMAIWAYLVVFHAVVHRFGRVSYDDDSSEEFVGKFGLR